MYLLSLLGVVLLLIASALADLPASTEIFYWPIGASQPSLLARVAYDPVSLKSNLVSYHPPTDTSKDGLVRVGLYTMPLTIPKQWSGSLVSVSSLTDDDHGPSFRLHLGPATEIYHVSLVASSTTPSRQVELVPNVPGTQPRLNKPVIIGPDGQDTEEEGEKSLLQKYWWVLLIVTFLTLSGGGEGQS
ncbi:uncharacterized protein N7459_006100 [Penicillium hispanicum]|uniref:uncharacterized protein n=1 Tax=Penicillium hispanicum TaxID=1080232 RepID=UPI00253FC47C|nr:uncharacterized protein N7459_006100 [Penicillium hispanicum]KAJ5580115.1 hypothetical protein N7459_006100 [Penicillium hispanicum]